MKIIITGITGQLDTALAETLSGEHDIIGLSRDSVSPFHTTIHADLCDWNAVYDAVTRVNPTWSCVPRAGITKCARKDLLLSAPRPAFSGLRNYLWELSGFTPLRPWQDAVAEFVERHT